MDFFLRLAVLQNLSVSLMSKRGLQDSAAAASPRMQRRRTGHGGDDTPTGGGGGSGGGAGGGFGGGFGGGGVSPLSRARSPAGPPRPPMRAPATPARPLAFSVELMLHKELGVAPGFLPPLDGGGGSEGAGAPSRECAPRRGLATTDFEVIGQLGRGSSGSVCRVRVAAAARRRGLVPGAEFALKVSNELRSVTDRARALEEFSGSLALGAHENVLPYYAVWQQDRRLHFLVKYCARGTLEQDMARRGALSDAEVCGLVRDIAKVRGVRAFDFILYNFVAAG